jgi:hypothetical protein
MFQVSTMFQDLSNVPRFKQCSKILAMFQDFSNIPRYETMFPGFNNVPV